ncbi:MAG: hypothetical protein ACRDSL_24690 [Pseudonocardiaceae bacterium]
MPPRTDRAAATSDNQPNFLIAPDGRILACKYGVHANNQWSVEELLHLTRAHTTELTTGEG